MKNKMSQEIRQKLQQKLRLKVMKEIKQEREQNKNAFFSLEAAIIVPLAISAILLAVGLFVFQYDRCLMEQDVAIQTVKAASAEAKSNEELEDKIRLQAAGLYRDKYVAWDMILMDIDIKKGMIEAAGKGTFQFPLPGWNLWNEDNTWSARAGYKAHRISPVTFIRNCRKIVQGGV